MIVVSFKCSIIIKLMITIVIFFNWFLINEPRKVSLGISSLIGNSLPAAASARWFVLSLAVFLSSKAIDDAARV